MNPFQKIFLLLLVLFHFAFCKGINKDKTNIGSIQIRYYKGTIETTNSIRCGSIMKEIPLTKDTLLIQGHHKIITQIKALKEMKGDNTPNCDIRMQCWVKCENGDSILLCIGEFDCLIKNGKKMKNNDSLIYLIRKYSGYYNYFSKEELKHFSEIKIFGIPQDYKYLLRIRKPNERPLSPKEMWLDN